MRKSLSLTAVAMSLAVLLTTADAQSQLRAPISKASRSETSNPQTLTCSPAPCVLPNVQVSNSAMPVTAAAIAMNPSNAKKMIVVTEDHNCTNGVGVASSSDGGTTWSQTCVLTGDGGSPIAGYDLNGNSYAGGLAVDSGDGPYEVGVASSADNGGSWGAGVNATANEPHYFTWSPSLTVDTNPGSPNKNALYVSSPQLSADGILQHSRLWVAHSMDGGAHWGANPVDLLQNYPLDDAYSNIAVSEDGVAYVAWLRCAISATTNDCAGSKGQILFSASQDSGNTWSTAVRIATVSLLTNSSCSFGCLPGSNAWMSELPALAVSGSGAGAQIYVTFYNWTGAQMQVEVAASSNGGSSWQKPVRVTTSNAGDEFFPWISIDGSGRLVATWMDRRNDPMNLLYQPFIAYSTDQGKTFQGDVPLSSVMSNPVPNPFSFFDAFGAYRNQVSVGNTTYAVWMDTRTGAFQIEVGGASF